MRLELNKYRRIFDFHLQEHPVMKKEDIKQVILQIFELQLEYQLRAIRQLLGKPDSEPDLVPRGISVKLTALGPIP